MNLDESVADVEGSNEVTLALTANQALVLFEWLFRTSEARAELPTEDKAEQIVLWNLSGMLESVLVSPFRADYDRLLKLARDDVRGAEG